MTKWIMLFFMKIQGIKIGSGFNTKGFFLIMKKKSAQINIGNNFMVKSAPFSNLLGLYQRTIIIARENAKITIGNNVGISGVTIHGTNISIGNYTAIGANTKIFDHDFHSLDYIERRTDSRTHAISKPVHIGNDVFIGCNCIITKGTVLGDRCIVGAGSVVTGKFPDDVVIAGNPAHIVRYCKGNGKEDADRKN